MAPASTWREVAYTDSEGRFSVLASVEGTWPLTASDSGFRAVTHQVSGSVDGPLEFKLYYMGTRPDLPPYERFDQGCRCGNLFR